MYMQVHIHTCMRAHTHTHTHAHKLKSLYVSDTRSSSPRFSSHRVGVPHVASKISGIDIDLTTDLTDMSYTEMYWLLMSIDSWLAREYLTTDITLQINHFLPSITSHCEYLCTFRFSIICVLPATFYHCYNWVWFFTANSYWYCNTILLLQTLNIAVVKTGNTCLLTDQKHYWRTLLL